MVKYPENPDIQKIIKSTQIPIVISVIVSLIIAGLGIGTSYHFENWSWFGRSGSLLVVCGVLLAKWDLDNLVSEKRLGVLDETILEVAKKKNPQFGNQPEDIEKVRESIKKRIIEYVKPQYIKAEVFIVCIGTVIWGYGDLLKL